MATVMVFRPPADTIGGCGTTFDHPPGNAAVDCKVKLPKAASHEMTKLFPDFVAVIVGAVEDTGAGWLMTV